MFKDQKVELVVQLFSDEKNVKHEKKKILRKNFWQVSLIKRIEKGPRGRDPIL